MKSLRAGSCLRSFQRPLSPYLLRKALTSSGSGYTLPASSAPSSADIASATSYCANLLKKYDSPSYTLLPFIPRATHAAYLAIRAFNLEIARIPDTASNPNIAALRFQFWRDTINSTFSARAPAHPISILLSSVLSDLRERSSTSLREPLSKSWFLRIIGAREQYAGGKPYTTLEDLERYAENTYSTLLYLTLQAVPLNSITADHLASHIGKAAGIVAVLRGLPLLAFPGPGNHHSNSSSLPISDFQQQRGGSARQGMVTLPLDVMAEANLCEEDVLRQGAEAPGLRDAVFAVATRASDHLITARTMLQNVSKGEDVGHEFEYQNENEHAYEPGTTRTQKEEVDRGFGTLMLAVSTGLWLERLQKVDFDIFREDLRGREWKLPWRAYWAFRRKKF